MVQWIKNVTAAAGVAVEKEITSAQELPYPAGVTIKKIK